MIYISLRFMSSVQTYSPQQAPASTESHVIHVLHVTASHTCLKAASRQASKLIATIMNKSSFWSVQLHIIPRGQ